MKIVEAMGIMPQKGEVGIEIEVEGHGLNIRGTEHWRVEYDGSLRGEGVEYVLSEPVKRGLVPRVLKEWSKHLKNAEILDTGRAGIHVHINVQELTKKQVVQFITLYLVMEPFLMRWCGDSRSGNLFCLSASDAPDLLRLIRSTIQRDSWHRRGNEVRYAAVNIASIPQYGSLEFRAMRSTPDIRAIRQWVEILLHIKDISQEFASPQQIIEQSSEVGMEEFFDRVLGDFMEFDLGSMIEGVRCAQFVAYAKDFDAPDEEEMGLAEEVKKLGDQRQYALNHGLDLPMWAEGGAGGRGVDVLRRAAEALLEEGPGQDLELEPDDEPEEDE
jgi:hypothetical protein